MLLRVFMFAEHLAPLQGKCIPALLDYGLWHEGTTFFVATTVVEGEHPGHNTSGASEAASEVSCVCLLDMHGHTRAYSSPWWSA